MTVSTDAGETSAPSQIGIVNFYEELGLDRDASTEILREQLEDLRLNYLAKERRAGQTGTDARRALELIRQAVAVFVDDDARERYDISLIRAPKPEAAAIKWLARGWNYYFNGDYGAATVAVRKAREQDSDNPMVFVLSAWIKVRQAADTTDAKQFQVEIKQAKQDADEAFALDELGEDTVDVHHARGVVMFLQGDNDKAIKSLDRSLSQADDHQKADICLWKDKAYYKKGDADSAFDACERGLSVQTEVAKSITDELTLLAEEALRVHCERTSQSDTDLKRYNEYRERILAGRILPESQSRLTNALDSQVQCHQDIAAENRQLEPLNAKMKSLESREKVLSEVPFSTGSGPALESTPAIIAAAGVAAVIWGRDILVKGIGLHAIEEWIVPVGILTVLVGLGWLAFVVSKKIQYRASTSAYESARKELTRVTQERSSVYQQIATINGTLDHLRAALQSKSCHIKMNGDVVSNWFPGPSARPSGLVIPQ